MSRNLNQTHADYNKNKKYKICLINNLYKPFNRGGADKITEAISDGFFERGHEIIIITTKPYFRKLPIPNSQFPIYYIPGFFYYLNFIPAAIRIFWHLIDIFDIVTYSRVKRILKKDKPDIVITNNLKGLSCLLPILFKRMGIRHLHILHDIQLIHPSGLLLLGRERELDSPLAKSYAKICAWLFGSPAAVVSPSQWLLDLHKQRGFFKHSALEVARNPIGMKPSEAANRRTTGRIAFMFIGQIEQHKGIEVLLRAFSIFSESNANATLTIIGGGRLRERLQERCRENANIEFTGRINSSAEIQKYLSAASAIIVPSVCYENSPSVIYEAAAAGSPVIGSDLAGIKELITEFGGYLFKPNDPQDLSEALARIVQDINTGAVIYPGRKIVEKYSINNYLSNLERFFK